jgi:endonuclease G
MKKILTILLILISYVGFAQVDTIIKKGIYTSHYSIKYKEPMYVEYTLFKAGGDCDRDSLNFNFKNDTKIPMATASDYNKSGYDKGHLANSEDFANDCIKDELTFRYYNCLPQTPNLNRGIWKVWETKIRDISQTDSLLIICGGTFNAKSKKIGKGVYVPDKCWKVVYSYTRYKVLYVLLFTNTDNATVKLVTLKELNKIIGHNLLLPSKKAN